MTDEAWIRGMGQLAACFPSAEESQERKAIRGQTYRQALNRLTDETWSYAVKAAIEHERWFPTVAALMDYANDAPAPEPKGLLPADTRSIEERREDFRRGFETFRKLFNEHVADLDALVESKGMGK